jgi:myosin-18
MEVPSATSTPLSNANLNTKKTSVSMEVFKKTSVSSEVIDTSHDSLDLVVNKNFINTAVTGNRYWTNQALQNDNSLKINQAMKLDLDYKEETINSLNKEIEDLQHGGATDEEVAGLKRQKADLDGRLKDQEEELDDLAGQVQMLEAAKTKLEMSMAAIKKEHRREVANKEEELEDIRAAAQKKIKALEQQLENEHEERINFVREKHELETRIINLQEMASRSADEEQVSKLKKDLKRTKALLKDAQLMVERSRNESSNKVVLRQLKNQLEDAEFAKTAAVKAKQNLELELSDVQTQLDDIMRSKSDVEDRLMRLSREKTDLSSQLEENEEELQEVMKKYKASVSQLSVDQITIQEQSNRVSDLEDERNKLKEQVAELSTRISSLEGEHITNPAQSRLELKVKELDSKLELEQTTRGRMDTQINRLKEAIEKLNHETDSLRHKEAAAQDSARKLQRQLRELKEDYANLQQKETETNAKKSEYEKLHELSEAETITARNDLKLALKRIEDLQTAINGELDSELSDLASDGDSDSSEEGMENFLEHHRRAVSVQRERESVSRDSMAREVLQREVRASVARESVVRQLETMPEEPELKL